MSWFAIYTILNAPELPILTNIENNGINDTCVSPKFIIKKAPTIENTNKIVKVVLSPFNLYNTPPAKIPTTSATNIATEFLYTLPGKCLS